MLRLPELKADSSKWHLPLFDRDAVQLLAALVATERFDRNAKFNRLLRSSPSFLLWAVCSTGEWQQQGPKSTQEVARWLATHALSLLKWPTRSTRKRSTTPARRAKWDELRSRCVATAEAAAELARTSHPDEQAKRAFIEETYLQGLLHASLDWMSCCGPKLALSRGAKLVSPLPDWLVGLVQAIDQKRADQGSLRQVLEALSNVKDAETRVATDELGDGSPEVDEEDENHLAGTVPGLVAKLARLEELENDFHSVLEREKLDSLRELAYGASHEINNPLANISTRAQTLLREESDPERRRKLATINSQAFRAHEMISDMMLFAKPPELAPDSLDVVELIDEVVTELSPLANEQGTRLRWTPVSPAPVLVGDRVQLAVALRSMCVNALEAMGADGIIEIQARQAVSADGARESWVEILVRDNGPGIPAEQRRHIFDPFYSGREAGRGLGLGLSKCWRIVSLHGGRIDVESEPGHGATFVVRLPKEASRLENAKGA